VKLLALSPLRMVGVAVAAAAAALIPVAAGFTGSSTPIPRARRLRAATQVRAG